MFTIISDFQYLTDRLDTKDVEQNTIGLLLDYLACGINPDISVIFIQSRVPALAELFVYFSMLVPVSRAQQNPTVKEEVRATAQGKMSLGMLSFPVSQAADILAFDADSGTGGGRPASARRANARSCARVQQRVYGETFKEPEALLSKMPRLMGLDAGSENVQSRAGMRYFFPIRQMP